MMDSNPKRIGSLFSLGRISSDDLPRFLQALRHGAVSRASLDRQRQILEAWFDLCTESSDGIVDRDTFCERVDITRSGLIHHLNALERLGMVSRSERRPDAKRRRVVCYTLRLPCPLATPAPEIPDLFDNAVLGVGDAQSAKLEERDALQALFSRSDSVTCTPVDYEKTTFKGERLTVFTLAPALNIGRQGAASKTTRIWRDSRSFVVTVRALAEHRIPNVQDLRPFVVAWTLARDQLPHLREGAPAQPVFVMSLRTICEQMGLRNPAANNLRQTFQRLRRFRSSEWQLTDDRYNVLKSLRTGGMLERDKYMSFISDLEVVSTVGAHGKTPEIIAITFHPALTPVLSDATRSLTLHKEFIQGKYREFDQLVYQWCRMVVQHNHDARDYALERVHREAHPSVSLVQFRQGLERMAADNRYERIFDAGYPMLLIPGYFLAFDFARNTVIAHARRDDPHLGTTSKYALARGGSEHRAAGGSDRESRPPSAAATPGPSRRLQDMRPGESGRAYGMRRLREVVNASRAEGEPASLKRRRD